MARERWYVDGYEITQGDTLDVEYRTGLLGTPGLRGENPEVANRTGTVWRPKKHGAGSFTLAMWWGDQYQSEAQEKWDELLRAFVASHRLATWTRVTASGETRTCLGEVVAELSPVAIGQQAYRAGIQVGVPDGYWQSQTSYTHSTPTGTGVVTRDLDLTDFVKSTAPNEKLLLTIAGQAVNPKIAEITIDGRAEWVQYNGTIPDGQSMIINCETWALTGTGGFVPDPQKLTYNGDRFFTLGTARPGVTTRVRFSADLIGANGRLTVAGRRSYLC